MFSTTLETLEDVENIGFNAENFEIEEAIRAINSGEVEKEMDITFKDKSTVYLCSATVLSHKSNELELRQIIPTLSFFDSSLNAQAFYNKQLRTGSYTLFRVAIPVQNIFDTLSPVALNEINEVWKKNKTLFKGLSAQQIMLKHAQNKYTAIRLLDVRKTTNYFISSVQYTYYKIFNLGNRIKIEFDF